MTYRTTGTAAAVVFLLLLAAPSLVFAQAATAQPEAVQAVVKEQVATEQAARQAQGRVTKLDDETRDMVQDYRAAIQETASVKRYNELLAAQVKSQLLEVTSIQSQIVEIERTNREIYPLMVRMLQTLGQFVQLDTPFLGDERRTRIANLNEMMGRADVSTAEKYRRLMEAYLIETEYGRTLEAYEGKLGAGEAARTVEFLRVGRIALLYQTLDGREIGYWHSGKKDWEVDNDFREAVKIGLKVAKKQSAPDFLVVPVASAEEAK